eukprot:scaffold1777_cov112-Skeletonema_dohrnii-CCMP3373.AAC.2
MQLNDASYDGQKCRSVDGVQKTQKGGLPIPRCLTPTYGFANHTQKRERNGDVRAVFCSQMRERSGFFRTVTIWPSIRRGVRVRFALFLSFYETHDIRLPFMPSIADCKHKEGSTIELLARLHW